MASNSAAERYFQAGEELYKSKKYREACKKYDSAIKENPEFAWAYYRWGRALAELEKYWEAVEKYQSAIKLEPTNAHAYCHLGNALGQIEQLDRARQQYLEAVKLFQEKNGSEANNADVLNDWGETLYGLSRYKQALDKFRDAIQVESQDAIFHSNLGYTLIELEKFEDAIASCRTAIQIDSTFDLAYYCWGYALGELEQIEHDITSYEKIIQETVLFAELHNGWGDVLYKLKQYDKALEKYQKAIELNAHKALFHCNEASALRDLKRYREAIDAYQQAIQLDADYQEAYAGWGFTLGKLEQDGIKTKSYRQGIEKTKPFADLYNGWGVALHNLERYDKALKKYQKAIELNAHKALFHCNKASALRDLKRYREAIDAYQQAIQIDLDYEDAYVGWGISLGKLDQRGINTESYQQAIEEIRPSAELYNSWGVALHSLKQYDTALEKYGEAIRLNSQKALFYYNKANALYALERYIEAIEAYQSAIQLDSGYQGAYTGWGFSIGRLEALANGFKKIEPDKLEQIEAFLKSYQEGIKETTPFAELYNSWGDALSILGEYNTALERYQKAVNLNAQRALFHCNVANMLQKQECYTKAIEAYRKAIAIDSSCQNAYTGWGFSIEKLNQLAKSLKECEIHQPEQLSKGLKQFDADTLEKINTNELKQHSRIALEQLKDDILERLEAFAKSHQKDIETTPFADFHNGQGNALYSVGEYDAALKRYQKAVSLNAQRALFQCNVANVLQELEHYTEAIEAYRKAIAIDSSYPSAYMGWGVTLGKLEELRMNTKFCRRGIENTPPFADLYNSWGETLYKFGKYTLARQKFHKAVKLQSGRSLFHVNLGRALVENKEYSEAIEAYIDAEKLNLDGQKFPPLTGYTQNIAAQKSNTAGLNQEDRKLNTSETATASGKSSTSMSKLGQVKGKQLKAPEAAAISNKQNTLGKANHPEELNTSSTKLLEEREEEQSIHYLWGVALGKLEKTVKKNDKKDKGFKISQPLIKQEAIFADMYRGWGDVLSEENEHESALKRYESAIQCDANSLKLHFKKGSTLNKLKRYDQAILIYKKSIIQLGSIDEEVYVQWGYNLGWLPQPIPPNLRPKQSDSESERKFCRLYDGWGKALHQNEKYEEALEKYEKAVEIDEENDYAHRGKGDTLLELRRFDEAIAAYKKAIEYASDPTDTNPYHYWGFALGKLGDLSQELKPNEGDSHKALAFLYNGWSKALNEAGEYHKAQEKLKQAIRIDPENPLFYANSGFILTNLKHYDEALQQYRAFIERTLPEFTTQSIDSKPRQHFTNGQICDGFEKKLISLASDLEEQAKLRDASSIYYIGRAKIFRNLSQYDSAVESYEMAEKLNVDYIYGVTDKILCYWEKGQYTRAWELKDAVEVSYKKHRKRAQEDENINFFRRFGYISANIFCDLQQAEEIYKRGIEIKPNSVDILIDLADLYFQKNNSGSSSNQEQNLESYWKAREYLSRARLILKKQIDETGEKAQLLIQLGKVYISEKDYEEAKKKLNQALKIDKEMIHRIKIFTSLGVLCIRQKKYEAAPKYFQKALELEPGNFTIASNLAEAYLRLELLKKAENQYRETLAIAPNHIESNIGLAEVYIKLAENGDTDLYKQAIRYLSEALEISKEKKGSKLLSNREISEVHYLRGYARTRLFEASRSIQTSYLLTQALKDFSTSLKNSSKNSPMYNSAKRAHDKLMSRFNPISSQPFSESIGRVLIMVASLLIFGLAQWNFIQTYFLSNRPRQ